MSHYSASQIKTFRLCPRKWWFEKISNVEPAPPHPAAALGSRVHEMIELYLDKTEIEERVDPSPSKEWRIAAPGRKYWPPVVVDYEIEEAVEIETPDDLPPVIGRIDLLVFERDGFDVEIVDHKTVGNWLYAATEETLLVDLQMNIYAKYVLDTYPDVKTIRLTHLQYATKTSPRCERVSVLASRETISEVWEGAVETMREMETFRKVESAHLVTETPSSCGAYGGCHYSPICSALRPKRPTFPRSPKPQEEGGRPMSSLADLLKKKKEAAAPNTPTAAPEPSAPVADYSSEAFSKALDVFLEKRPVDLAEARLAVGDCFNVPKGLRKTKIEEVVKMTKGVAVLRGNKIDWMPVSNPVPVTLKRPDPAPPRPSLAPEKGFVVLVDCLPQSGAFEPVVTLEELIAPLIADSAVDPQLMDYAKGIIGVARDLVLPVSGTLLVDSRSPYWGRCLPKIYSAAALVVKAVR